MNLIPINLIGGAVHNRSRRASESKCINLIPESAGEGGRTKAVYHGAPGMDLVYDFGSHARGLEFFDNKLWGVFGGKFYLIQEAQSPTPELIGSIPDDGDLVYIGSGNGVVAVGNNTSTLYYANSTTLQSVSAGSRTTGGGCFIDGKFVFFDPGTERWWSTESTSAITIDAADTTTAVSKSDHLVGTFNHDQQLLLPGKDSIEVWATATTGDPPFSKRLTIPVGVASGKSMASLTSGVCFLGSDRQVYQLQGYSPVPIGDDIQSELQKATQDNIDKAFAFSYKEGKAEFYWLTIPDTCSFVFDSRTGLWHQRSSGVNEEQHKAVCHVKAWGDHYIGTSDGKLCKLNIDTFTDNGEVIKQVRSFRIVTPEGEDYLTMDKLVIIHDTGTEATTAEPKLGCRYSKDGKMTWAEKEPVSMGKHGDYKNETWFWQFGSFKTLDLEIYNANACRVTILGAYGLNG